MNLAYTKKLGLQVKKTNTGMQKIERSNLDTFEIVIASFQVQDKL